MGQQQGANVKLVCQSETTFGQVPGTSDPLYITFVSESIRQSRNLVSSKSIRQDRNPNMPVRGNLDVAGDLTFELAWAHGRILRHALGNYTAVSGSSMFTHTMSIGTSLPIGLTIEKQFADLATAQYFQYSGLKVNSLKMAFSPEGFIECTASFMGKKETVAASSAFTLPTDLGHQPWDGVSIVIQEGAGTPTTLAVCSKIDFSLENNLDGSSYVIDSTSQRHSIPAGTAKVSGNLTALFEDVVLYNKAVNYTESQIVITLTRGTGAGTTGNEKLTITIPELVYKPQAPVTPGPQGVVVDLPFEAYYDNASQATALQMVLLCNRSYF